MSPGVVSCGACGLRTHRRRVGAVGVGRRALQAKAEAAASAGRVRAVPGVGDRSVVGRLLHGEKAVLRLTEKGFVVEADPGGRAALQGLPTRPKSKPSGVRASKTPEGETVGNSRRHRGSPRTGDGGGGRKTGRPPPVPCRLRSPMGGEFSGLGLSAPGRRGFRPPEKLKRRGLVEGMSGPSFRRSRPAPSRAVRGRFSWSSRAGPRGRPGTVEVRGTPRRERRRPRRLPSA